MPVASDGRGPLFSFTLKVKEVTGARYCSLISMEATANVCLPS